MSILASAADSFSALKLAGALLNRCGDGGAHFVQQFADDRLLVFAERFHLLAPGGNAPAAAEVTHARGLERLLVRRGIDLAQRFGAQLFERVGHERNVNVQDKTFNKVRVDRAFRRSM